MVTIIIGNIIVLVSEFTFSDRVSVFISSDGKKSLLTIKRECFVGQIWSTADNDYFINWNFVFLLPDTVYWKLVWFHYSTHGSSRLRTNWLLDCLRVRL